MSLAALVCVLQVLLVGVGAETLTPPYFNLAEGKNITASATCGVGTEGPELYCKLIGANSDNDITTNLIQGQYCDECDPTRPDKTHPPEHAVDGIETWWQSPPLSRGMKYNEVNLTIDLGQEFHVAYVFIKMANSPRPGLWVLEKSADYGKTYTPWQYFSDSPADCERFFGRESLQPITRDDSVICTTEYSKIVPLEGGEIPISLLNKRPSANHYFNSTILQEWTRATNVRLRFLRTKNLLGHLMSVARQDPSVTRRYFYSIKDISIGGRCMCNGHADACDIPDPRNNQVLLCRCKHNTCGAKCDVCCPGYEQKAWRQSKHNAPFICEPCNCFQHSNECIYDKKVDEEHRSLDIHGRYEGGGVCQNCQHNTEGINCNKCKSRFYRPYEKQWNETDVCQPCQCDNFYSTGNCAEGSGRCECRKEFTPPNCDSCSFGYYDYPNCKPCECYVNGTLNLQCSSYDGQCPCLPNFGGRYCTECSPGYYNFPECVQCECDALGSVSEVCDQNGTCTCKNKYAGDKCDHCRDGYYYAEKDCLYCNCDISGTEEEICDKKSGRCLCKPGYGGDRCDVCISGYYGYPDCKPCNCSKVGSHGSTCTTTGKCSCLANYAGRTCSQCSPGYYSYPDCTACDCDPHGSNGLSCDQTGTCECHKNFAGQRCDMCKEGYYNFPACEDCNCHPAGVVEGFPGCGSVPPGELCQCKERVEGRICDKCRPLYWNLNINNPDGCEECNCTRAGVLGGIGVCDIEHGQCVCKPSVISRSCSECADGTYGLSDDNLFGCRDCGCDVGGSTSNVCHKQTGQCFCQSRVIGRQCREPLQAHYFPTLYQYQYEVEDGHTLENKRVRYAYDEQVFPNYSWKGYAVFNLIQKEIIHNIFIQKSSLYRMVLRFMNPNPSTVIGGIKIIPENPNEIEQYIKVQFRNTTEPAFVTVSGETGNTPKPFVMNPGRWSVSINVNQSVFLDYFVLLPEDFYLATILNQKVVEPCTINRTDFCRHYAYPNISMFDKSWGVGGFIKKEQRTDQLTEWFANREHLQQIFAFNKVPLLNANQPDFSITISLRKSGPYVLLVNYVSPLDDLRTQNVSTIIHTRNGMENGNLKLYSCPYTTMCRQVVTNDRFGVGVYDIDDSYVTVDFKTNNANVGIHSVYAIPYEEWSLDYIKPKPVCVFKNGSCIPSSFRNPPETKRIQFEQEAEGELSKNKLFFESAGDWLSPTESSIDLKGKVANPGYYTFIIHYYQPHYPKYNLDVIIQNGLFYEAKVPVEHCPSKSGCRAVLTQNDRNNKFLLTENFMVTFKQPGNKNVFLGYLMVVPTDLYNDRNLEEEDLDRTGEFISMCGSNHFNINTIEDGFCKDSVFSITAAHNTGALPCQCDFAGSLSFECEKFGGQCQCKENIIGRKCEACKTGYYGFPLCKPCNCPSTAYCEPNTGQCICPSHVTGERCDQCEPYTYGYDPLIGCEECNCNTLGVNGTLQCNLLNGECSCKENVVGRPCDKCKAGHYFYPVCQSCECDTRGTTAEICDQVSAECFCKKNVVALRCDYCREGSFNLQADNEEGCTDCFCFGKTTRCMSSQLVKVPILTMKDWEIVNVTTGNALNVTKMNIPIDTIDGYDEYSDELIVNLANINLTQSAIYFSAPFDYLGQKLTSYGGYLKYTIYYYIGEHGSALNRPDVILQGADTYLSFTNFEQPAPSNEFFTSVLLVESNFELPGGIPAKREHIMEVLRDLRGVYIRAAYWTSTENVKLMNVLKDDAIEPEIEINENTPFALSVEQCLCPPNYQGLSCEDCAPGFYRIKSGPHGGFCVPCECHGHATECDVNTGICLNCSHNTRGDHCEFCEIGYHGNAKAGTPMDCLICACPLPIASNNFAAACDVSSDGEKISCECVDGYIGARCQSCAPGFYGRPDQAGDYCKPCQCSGNINPDDPSSCDTVSGDCLRCLNNTFGVACSLCAPGYFGDAVNLKDCQACICDELGTERCDSYTGRCVCKPNVIGEKCDRCEVEHYGFQSGRGCASCSCGEASESEQCDDVTGQCKCKPGVTGRTCDRCTAGYWNYTSEGCVSCGCKSEYSLGFGCNVLTGQCECLNGVLGEKCDHCPHRWAFVPEFGCHQCDTCHHALLDDTDQLALMIDEVINEFDSTQSGFFTRRRLQNMNEKLEHLIPLFHEVDPKKVSLNGTIQELERLEQDSKNLNRKSNYSLETSDRLQNQSEKLKDKEEILLDDIFNIDEDALRIIDDIEKITGELHQEAANEIERAVEEGQALLEGIKIYNLTGRENDAQKQLEKVEEVLKNVTEYKRPVQNLQGQVDDIKDDLKSFNDKLDDLYNHTQYSLNVASEAENIISKSGKDRLKNKLASIENHLSQAKVNLNESERLLSNATDLLDSSFGKLKDLKDAPKVIQSTNEEFEKKLEDNKREIEAVKELRPKVEEHAANLSERVQQLEHILSESQLDSRDAVKAARAFKDIVEAVRSAREAAEGAQNDTTHASSILSKVQDETIEAEEKSADALDTAYKWNQLTRDSLKPNLSQAISQYQPVKSVHDNNENVLRDLEKILDHIRVKDLEQVYRDASENAKVANGSINEVGGVLESTTFVELPKETNAARSLSKELDDAKRSLVQTEKQINTTNTILPEVEKAVKEIPEVQEEHQKISDGIKANVDKLNQQIALARDIANRIKVGVAFLPSTYLELRNPKNIEDLAITTKFSGYFKTNQSNGFLFYIGNPNGTNLPKTKTDDYMALIIENSYPTLIIDVGNGVEKIVANAPVEHNKWYQYEVNRVGNSATLTIRSEDAEGKITSVEKTAQLSGPLTIFNLDKEKSKVFVGGFPSKYEMPNSMHDINSFQGEMEEVVIGNTPVSLWNFKDGYDNRNGIKERDGLVVLAPSTGFRFNGNGFIVQDARSLPIRSKTTIELKFKTFSPNGLILLAAKGKTFISLEIRNGYIIYQYNLGESTKLWITSKTYNDGNWHKISAARDGPKGNFLVDTENVADNSSPISGSVLEPIDTISFGGYPEAHNHSEVTETRFDGCISNITIMGEPVDLRNNIQAYDVTPGCPDKFSPMVSFSKDSPGYVGWDRLSVSNNFNLVLRFKTKEKNGLIFYVGSLADRDQENFISLSLKDGVLVLISMNIELTSKELFNDNQWHVVSVTHDNSTLRLVTDDYVRASDSIDKSLHLLYANIYIGGLPSRLKLKAGRAASTDPFAGCIADLTVLGQVKNFANTTGKSREILDQCILDTPSDRVQVPVSELPSTLPPKVFTTYIPPVMTENPNKQFSSGRGDGGVDVGGTLSPPVEVTENILPETQRPEVHLKPETQRPDVHRKPVGTVPTTTKATPVQGCALPVHPIAESKQVVGYRFGTKTVSRLEFPTARGRYKKSFDFRFEFRSKEAEGLLAYVANRSHKQYAAAYLQDGHVVFTFKGEHAPVTIKSKDAFYADDNWHTVELFRDVNIASITIDDKDSNSYDQKTGGLDINVPFYVGGVSPNENSLVQGLLNVTTSFRGCIRGISMNDKPLENPTEFGIIPCSDNVESGVFFDGDNQTFVKLKDRFKVGEMFTIKLDIKPRVNSGLLVAAHGRKDYFVLELHNGDVRLTVDNGKGPVTTVFYHNNTYHLCDGEWHSIQAVKSRNVVTLSVDNVFNDPKIGSTHSVSADTGSALFLGGHRFLARVRGISSRVPYVGCIKNIEMNNDPVQLTPKMVQGNITIGFCPTN